MALTLTPDVLDSSPAKVAVYPLAVQLADHIRQGLADHDLEPGEIFPSEEEIRAAVGLSRPTIQKALADLEAEGLIVRRKGARTMVAIPPSVAYRNITRYAHEYAALKAGEHPPRTFITDHGATDEDFELRGVEITQEPASALDAEYLRVKKRSPILRRRMVECLGGEPIQIHRQAFPYSLAKDKRFEIEVSPQGLLAELLAAGVEPTHYEKWVRSRMPNRTERTLLEMGGRGPVDETIRRFVIVDDPDAPDDFTGYDFTPVQVSKIISPSARNMLYVSGRLSPRSGQPQGSADG